MVRYYGWYSNVTRGKRLKRAEHDAVPYIIESDRSPAACRKTWARLIQKIYEVFRFHQITEIGNSLTKMDDAGAEIPRTASIAACLNIIC